MLEIIKKDLTEDYVDGELCERYFVGGHQFDIYCGYLTEIDRKAGCAVPIYPDFKANPRYDPEGYPLTTFSAPACEHHEGRINGSADQKVTCASCVFFDRGDEEFIGICRHKQRRRNPERNE